jgi:murein DD-endopeptidase MepM/ murein hydrolase activator NlpD
VGGVWRLVGVHEGIDIAAERGTPVLSMEPGVVENEGWTFYSGTRIGVRGDDGRYYLYAHLSSVAPGIPAGSRVDAGTMLGRVGNTGYGPPGERDQFPPHLHFGMQTGSTWVDPYGLLVSLYRATVSGSERSQARLDAVASVADRTEWERLEHDMFLTASPPSGE